MSVLSMSSIIVLLVLLCTPTQSFTTPAFTSSPSSHKNIHDSIQSKSKTITIFLAVQSPEKEKTIPNKTDPSVEETTKSYGLEAGLFQSLRQKDTTSAKALLAKYGIAYLATSIPLAIVSFTLCYILVDSGVDVNSLLNKVGLGSYAGDTGEKVGTFAIAYAAHKAASPIRFPPTVLLTPVVAKWIGKEPVEEGASSENDEKK